MTFVARRSQDSQTIVMPYDRIGQLRCRLRLLRSLNLQSFYLRLQLCQLINKHLPFDAGGDHHRGFVFNSSLIPDGDTPQINTIPPLLTSFLAARWNDFFVTQLSLRNRGQLCLRDGWLRQR